jgi:hypothetical protein
MPDLGRIITPPGHNRFTLLFSSCQRLLVLQSYLFFWEFSYTSTEIELADLFPATRL